MIKAIGYIRVSTDEQAKEGVSLENQEAKIRAYCNLKDFEILEIVQDAGISAKNLRRPGAQKVIEMARNKMVNAVVVYKLDRMFRSTSDALLTTKQFDQWGVSFHSISENLDTKSAMGKFFFTLTAALAEMEREIIGERTRDVLQRKKANGEVYGHVPFGFKRFKGRLIAHKDEQKIIQTVLGMRQEGLNYSRISRELNQMGLKTKKGNRWYPQTVKNVIALQGTL
ncbi:MAG: recombinase family protein [Deltaproteobacteria bacterium]|nr:recombinase family protein [Deltaproteobacteria bacterium]